MTKNEIIAAYIAATEAEKRAKKQAEEMKNLIIEFMGPAATIETDLYSVIIKETETTRLDTKSLYKDFPDIKKDYGKTSVSRSVTIAARSAAATKTA